MKSFFERWPKPPLDNRSAAQALGCDDAGCSERRGELAAYKCLVCPGGKVWCAPMGPCRIGPVLKTTRLDLRHAQFS